MTIGLFVMTNVRETFISITLLTKPEKRKGFVSLLFHK